jgi:glycosyltransferase involved in cell wall biosynthesis
LEPQPDGRGLRLLVTVTFNENQLRSHLLPIVARDEVESVVLVADEAPAPLPKLRTVVPPRLLVRLVGRAPAKLLVCAALALRLRPAWVVGFNLVPHGANAILTAGLARARSLYVMIGGDREWREGGWDSDNAILGRLPRPVPLVERALLRLVGRSSVVATMGESGRRALLARGLDPGRIRVIPPAVDVDRFTAEGRPEPRWDVLTVGALLPVKRTADLLRALAQLVPDRPGLRAAVAGEGSLEQELHALVRELGLERNVELLGFRADVEALYRAARIFVLPSAYEGLSVALLEAMASGTVPVVTDVGELRSFVRDGETGRLVPVGDVDALARVLGELLDDPPAARGLAAAAVREVRARASVEAVARTYADLFAAR